jgi:hypothetical protein
MSWKANEMFYLKISLCVGICCNFYLSLSIQHTLNLRAALRNRLAVMVVRFFFVVVLFILCTK